MKNDTGAAKELIASKGKAATLHQDLVHALSTQGRRSSPAAAEEEAIQEIENNKEKELQRL